MKKFLKIAAFVLAAAINIGFILQNRIYCVPRAITPHLVKTALAACMAGNTAFLLDLHHDGITITIQTQFVHLLGVARFFALEPQLAARAAEVHGAAELGGLGQRLAVHPREHEHIVAAALLGDHRHQAGGVPLHFIEPIHTGHCQRSVNPAPSTGAWASTPSGHERRAGRAAHTGTSAGRSPAGPASGGAGSDSCIGVPGLARRPPVGRRELEPGEVERGRDGLAVALDGVDDFITLPPGIDAKAMLPRAVTARVAYVPGTAFYADQFGTSSMRLSFCYPTPERIREGVRRLAGVLEAELELRETFDSFAAPRLSRGYESPNTDLT